MKQYRIQTIRFIEHSKGDMLSSQMGGMPPFLFFLVFIECVVVQLREIQKLCQGHIERQCDLVQRFNSGILGKTADDVVQSRLLDVAHGGEFVYGNAALFAELADALYIEIRVFHDVPHIVFTRLRVRTMITAQREAITRIRVDKENKARYNYVITRIRVEMR